MAMNLIEALPLGILEGVTEFLPVSSTGHLTIAEGLLGLKVDDPGVTALTAIIQVGAILAVIIYFRSTSDVWPALGSAASLTARPAKRRLPVRLVCHPRLDTDWDRALSSPRPDLGASAQLCGSRWWWRSWAGAR
jgi:undecaprenyl pyrophosphate phosphatase UppP